MDLEEIGINAGNWVDSAQDRNCWRALVNEALNLRVHKPWSQLIRGPSIQVFSSGFLNIPLLLNFLPIYGFSSILFYFKFLTGSVYYVIFFSLVILKFHFFNLFIFVICFATTEKSWYCPLIKCRPCTYSCCFDFSSNGPAHPLIFFQLHPNLVKAFLDS